MSQHRLLLSKNYNNKALRTPKAKPRSKLPNSWWGIDMT